MYVRSIHGIYYIQLKYPYLDATRSTYSLAVYCTISVYFGGFGSSTFSFRRFTRFSVIYYTYILEYALILLARAHTSSMVLEEKIKFTEVRKHELSQQLLED